MKDLKIDESTGLVLEGGGMRGVFTCGVLDYDVVYQVSVYLMNRKIGIMRARIFLLQMSCVTL